MGDEQNPIAKAPSFVEEIKRQSKKEGAVMVTDRWDGDDIHYYEYESLERYPGTDTFKVAEAYVYNNAGFALGAVLVVSAQDLHAGVTPAHAIKTARERLHDLVRRGVAGNYFDSAQKLRENQTFLHAWNGQILRRVL